MDNSIKKGPLGVEEMDFIKQRAQTMSPQQIADALRRKIGIVVRFIKENNLVSVEMTDREKQKFSLKNVLYSKDYWGEIQKQFSEDELKYFENLWIELLIQFREDILYSEELTIKQYITLDILANRNLAERQSATVEMEDVKRQLEIEYDKDDRDETIIIPLEQRLSLLKSAIPSYASEYTKLLDKIKSVQTDLKANRDQRVKRIENSQTTFAGYIRMLEDEANRDKEGFDIELMKRAKEKASRELGQFHTFMDGEVDRPLLNTDTINQGDEEEDG
jgi:hypothetical protein